MDDKPTPGTLYADWLRRREQLAAYQGQREPIVALQLRVLDFLLDRYRDDAAALVPAPAPWRPRNDITAFSTGKPPSIPLRPSLGTLRESA